MNFRLKEEQKVNQQIVTNPSIVCLIVQIYIVEGEIRNTCTSVIDKTNNLSLLELLFCTPGDFYLDTAALWRSVEVKGFCVVAVLLRGIETE